MICPKCGAQIPDDSAFCTSCGAQIAQAAPQPAPQPAYAQPAPAYAQPAPAFAPQPAHDAALPVRKSLKELITSPLFIIAAIGLTVALILGIVTAFNASGSVAGMLEDALDQIADQVEIPASDMRDIRKMFDEIPDVQISPVSVIVGQLPSILMCVGVLMLLASGLSSSERINPSGLTIIKVLNVITLVLTCIGFGLGLLALIASIVITAVENVEAAPIILGIVTIPVAIAAVFVILYYAKLVKTINTMRKVVETESPSDKVSAFVAVLCIIGGVGSGISFISSLVSGAILTALADACNAAALICFGLIIFKFRERMQELMKMMPVGGFVPPAYAGASYAQQPANPYSAPLTVCPNCRGQHPATDAVCPFCGYSANPR